MWISYALLQEGKHGENHLGNGISMALGRIVPRLLSRCPGAALIQRCLQGPFVPEHREVTPGWGWLGAAGTRLYLEVDLRALEPWVRLLTQQK